MEYHERKLQPFKTILFIVLGGALIILADIFVFGDQQRLWDNIITSNAAAKSARIAALKEQHSTYMEEGIEIDPSILAQSGIPIPRSMPSKTLESTPASVIAKNDLIEDSPTLDALIAEQKEIELASIQPATGVDTPEENMILEGESGSTPKATYQSEEEKTVADILDNLGVEEKAAPELDTVIEEISVQEKSPETTISYTEPEGNGLIAIIIDDMGITLRSKLVEVMEGPLTLAYLPYAKNLDSRTKRATEHGHELMLHMPMEPLNGKLDGGPKVLRTGQSTEEFTETLEWGLTQFEGFVGVNNHMGSRLTKDANAMQLLMSHLKDKDLFFIDSKTIGSSVAASTAKEMGIPYAERDVFLDHEISSEFVEGALEKLEDVAKEKGYAIAIGHPHKVTVTALKNWLPTLKDKGLTLVPVSQLVKQPSASTQDLIASDSH